MTTEKYYIIRPEIAAASRWHKSFLRKFQLFAPSFLCLFFLLPTGTKFCIHHIVNTLNRCPSSEQESTRRDPRGPFAMCVAAERALPRHDYKDKRIMEQGRPDRGMIRRQGGKSPGATAAPICIFKHIFNPMPGGLLLLFLCRRDGELPSSAPFTPPSRKLARELFSRLTEDITPTVGSNLRFRAMNNLSCFFQTNNEINSLYNNYK